MLRQTTMGNTNLVHPGSIFKTDQKRSNKYLFHTSGATYQTCTPKDHSLALSLSLSGISILFLGGDMQSKSSVCFRCKQMLVGQSPDYDPGWRFRSPCIVSWSHDWWFQPIQKDIFGVIIPTFWLNWHSLLTWNKVHCGMIPPRANFQDDLVVRSLFYLPWPWWSMSETMLISQRTRF